MQECCTCGSVRGALGNWRPYRDGMVRDAIHLFGPLAWSLFLFLRYGKVRTYWECPRMASDLSSPAGL
jgi:hypothetical protein